jgi:hypothetical protein
LAYKFSIDFPNESPLAAFHKTRLSRARLNARKPTIVQRPCGDFASFVPLPFELTLWVCLAQRLVCAVSARDVPLLVRRSIRGARPTKMK